MTDERRIARVLDAPWLPPGSTAEAWAGNDCQVIDPVIVTRLLLVRRSSAGTLEFFRVPTPRGPNLPTRYLWGSEDHESVADGTSRLMTEVFGRGDLATRCIGFIRNVVPTLDPNYAYPSPWAHVPVFLVTDTAEPIVAGDWVGADRAHAELADRHWWPIVGNYLTAQDA
ncbi:hypothetical protein [Arthrobacter sp. ERGS1:01]|uniref:hypothetical protein n=1 Tax=Arthrobacter sp. ERGS1:01 TaxID=1704044 RepID=UPI0006B5DA75|nr:hypothetical protein [Arthrobacter sp. ERGS1:01]